jgi:hypothetical protein
LTDESLTKILRGFNFLRENLLAKSGVKFPHPPFRRRLPVIRLIVLSAVLSSAPALFAQRPIPPGVRQADQAEEQRQKDLPPAPTQHSSIDLAKLKHDADELATLAQSIPPEVDQTTKGILPKDLGDKLKRIEKLAKQLRSQLTP